MRVDSPMQALHAWQQKQPAAYTPTANSDTDMRPVFLHMLKSSFSNPLQKSDPADMMRIMREITDSFRRNEEQTHLKEMHAALQQANLLGASMLASSHDAQIKDNRVIHTDTYTDKAFYTVPQNTQLSNVRIDMMDADTGHVHARIDGPTTHGTHALDDALGDELQNLPEGTYTFQVTGLDQQHAAIQLETWVQKPLTQARLVDGQVHLISGNTSYDLSKLVGLLSHNNTAATKRTTHP